VNIGVYARISDDATDLRLGVKRQEADARALAKVRHWQVGRLYVDNDVSAFNTKVKRPEFEQLLLDLSAGLLDGVVTYDLDRFARQPSDLERAIEIFDARSGLVFATVQSDIDLSTPDGRTMARVMVAFANKSSMDTSRRLKRKHLELAQNGEIVGTQRPFGYEDDRRTIRESEAELIRQAALDVLAGDSMHGIARRWNAQGITTSKGNGWRQTTFRNMILSPRHAGYRVHKGNIALDTEGKPVMAKRQPILDVATWEALHQFITDPARTGPSTHPGGQRRLLSGLTRCGRCGTPMLSDRDHRRGIHTYVCKSQTTRGGCGTVGVSGPRLDELVTELVLRYLADRRAPKEIEAWADEGQLSLVTDRMSELMSAFTDGELSSDVVFPMISQLENQANSLRTDRARWFRDQIAVASRPTNASEVWPDLDVDQQRAVIQNVLQSVVVKPAEKKGGRFDPARVEIVWQ
jgi:DNA invertase Pin-like site-specific DNA recombinase